MKSSIFEKGDYRKAPDGYRILGISSLESLTTFQNEFGEFDTDTTINSIRDSMIGNYLGFDLLNFAKHGFDAKNQNEILIWKSSSVL